MTTGALCTSFRIWSRMVVIRPPRSCRFRVQGEADPTVADWSEEPTFVLSQVRTMMALGSAEAPAAQVKRAAAGRVALERKVRTALAPALRPVFDEAVAQAQRALDVLRGDLRLDGRGLVGRERAGLLQLVDALGATFRTVKVRKDPNCPACGTRTLTQLIDYEQFCGSPHTGGEQKVSTTVPEITPRDAAEDRKSTRLNSSHMSESRMPSSA